MRLGRRELIGHGVSAAGFGLLFGGSLRRPGQGESLPETVANVLRDQPAARKVGRRYLAAYPQEANARLLTEAVAGEAPATHAAALRQHLAACRRTDFAKGDTVLVDGWVLARSEARLCALSALVTA